MQKPQEAILIAAITPYFLERGVLFTPKGARSPSGWFDENRDLIKTKLKADPWWQEHLVSLELGGKTAFSPFLRKLTDIGYVKVSTIENRGEFAARGGIVDVFPINVEEPIRIEFLGNTIEAIHPIPLENPARPCFNICR